MAAIIDSYEFCGDSYLCLCEVELAQSDFLCCAEMILVTCILRLGELNVDADTNAAGSAAIIRRLLDDVGSLIEGHVNLVAGDLGESSGDFLSNMNRLRHGELALDHVLQNHISPQPCND